MPLIDLFPKVNLLSWTNKIFIKGLTGKTFAGCSSFDPFQVEDDHHWRGMGEDCEYFRSASEQSKTKIKIMLTIKYSFIF